PSQFWLLLGAFGVLCSVLITSRRATEVMQFVFASLAPRGKFQKLRSLAEGWPDLLNLLKNRRRWIVPFSLLLWLGHLFQIWMFTVALSTPIPFTVCASLSAIALMAGQVPLTFAGVGTRDVALVVLLSHYMTPETAAAMGVLVSTRNILPPLMGMPIIGPY